MRILTFVTETHFEEKKQVEQANLLLYYAYKEMGTQLFNRKDIVKLFSDAGKSQKLNPSRIIKDLKRNEYIRVSEADKTKLEMVPINLQRLAKEYDRLWLGLQYIDSNSEIINEERYCGKREAIDKIIKQINCCYAQHCFDACAVLMRRLFEILLVLSFQRQGIDNEIKDSNSGGYLMLERIVQKAQGNSILKLSRNKNKYDAFRNLGNYSAHNIYYVCTVNEIDGIRLDYKAMMDELFEKAGLFSS